MGEERRKKRGERLSKEESKMVAHDRPDDRLLRT